MTETPRTAAAASARADAPRRRPIAAVLACGLAGLAALVLAGCAHHGVRGFDLKAPAPVSEAALPVLDATVDPNPADDPDNVLFLDLSNGGRVTIRLMPGWAPHHVERIKTLARQGFYDGIIFHRVIDGFMAQTGDPTGTGQGGSKLPDLKAEFNTIPHVRGTVSMARTEQPDSANSQFFIMFYPKFALDRHYTNFGRVIAGMENVDAIARGEPPSAPTKIVQASIESDHKPRPTFVPPVSAGLVNQLPGTVASPAGGARGTRPTPQR